MMRTSQYYGRKSLERAQRSKAEQLRALRDAAARKLRPSTTTPAPDAPPPTETPAPANGERTFICARCGGTFERDRPEGEARAELAEFWPGFDVTQCDVVCDACWDEIRPDTRGISGAIVEREESAR
jgi:hypothetical protein